MENNKEVNMVEVWKLKLRELRLQEALLRMDQSKKEELEDIRKMIQEVRKELAHEMSKEIEEKRRIGK